jgi:DNA polymerase III subunit delta'
MSEILPINQIELFGLNKFFNELVKLYKKNKLPNKILLSGPKGLGKSTLSYHFINYVLSLEEEFEYDYNNLKINPKNRSFKTIQNRSNPNFILVDVNDEKKFIDINQIRSLILNLNKSSFNKKPRFILIDNIELLNINSVNALLKIIEEPSNNVHFILVNNNKKILPTLSSRCINFKIHLSNEESLTVVNKLLNDNLQNIINYDLINYYLTPGYIYNLAIFGKNNNFDLKNINLSQFIKSIIGNKYFKKDDFIKSSIYDFIEFYFTKINSSFSTNINSQYNYFLKRISNTKKFNLDEDSLFMEFEDKILNG